MNLQELIAARAAKLEEMKALNEANPTMDDATTAKYTQLNAEFEAFNRNVNLAKTQNVLAGEVDEVLAAANVDKVTNTLEYITNFDSYLAGQNVQEAMNAMTEGVDADGGFIVPVSYQKTVVEKLNELSATRSISTVIGTESTRNIPTEGDAPTFAWIDESGAYGETKSTFGNKQIGAYKLGGIIKVSEELLQDKMIDFDSYMARQIARGIDKAEAPAFATGNGTLKPTGYSVTAPVGASSTTAAVAAVTGDEIIDIFYDLKAEYRKNASWRMTDKTEKAISKLKNTNGDYIFDQGLDSMGRSTIKGRPIVIDNSMPELGAGNKFIVFGDFSYFQIGDRGGMSIQRLNELYAGTGMVGFKVHKRVDAKVIIEEAFNAGQNAAV